MISNFFYRSYARLFAKPFLLPIHRFLYRLSLRGMGILNSEDDYISGEEHFIKFLQRKSPKTIIDVGANEGQFAKLCLKHTQAQVYSFEPHPKTFAKLQNHIADDRWQGFEMGLGSQTGKFSLFDHAAGSGTQHASLQKNVFSDVYQQDFEEIEVQVQTLDIMIERLGIKSIDLLKIDVEGFELEVLKGASELLTNGKIQMIMFEFNSMNISNNVSFRSFENILTGFSFFRLLPNSFVPLDKTNLLFKEIYAFQNILAIKH